MPAEEDPMQQTAGKNPPEELLTTDKQAGHLR